MGALRVLGAPRRQVATLGALAAAVAAALTLTLPVPASAEAAEAAEGAECAEARAPGGEWRAYGRNLRNTRHQQHERTISAAEAPRLAPSWSLSVEQSGGAGSITGTPVVVDGCVYVATNQGWVFALNADTGEPVWKRQIPHGGPVFGTVAVRRGLVYVAAAGGKPASWCVRGSCAGPYVVALRQRNGRVAWVSRALDVQPGADVYGSPVIFRGVLMIGVSGGYAELSPEGEDRYLFQGSIVFLEARTGRVLRKSWTLGPPDRPEDEYAGATVWSTPAVDRRERVAYAGTSNPYVPGHEHEHANAVLKLDVDRTRRRFGRIIGVYKGTPEQYFEEASEMPCVEIPGNVPPYPTGVGGCNDLDLDFGASPNLFWLDGRKVIGAGQKSGVYHVFDARTMEPIWERTIGVPGPFGGILGSTAYDGESLYGPLTIPGYVWSLSAADGAQRWLGPIGDGLHWGPPVAVANGVVYTVDLAGFLDAFDAETGRPLLKRPLMLGTEHPRPSPTWGGVSVARNTVYATVGLGPIGSGGGYVVAFRVDGEGP